MSNVKNAEHLLEEGKIDECLKILNEEIKISGIAIETLWLKAKIEYRLQKWGDCLNNLNRILEIDPNHTSAQNYKLMVLNIINFWNKDSFNP